MTGRDLFKKLSPMIEVFIFILKFLPKFVHLSLWSIANIIRGKIGIGIRYCLVRCLAKKCGDNVLVGVNVEIFGWDKLELGNNVSIHRECYLDASGGINIGSNVSIAHQTSLVSFNHDWTDESIPIKYNQSKLKPILIENDVWIGCGVRILSGVTIGTRSIIAAGAIVVKNVESRTVVGGNPARVLKVL